MSRHIIQAADGSRHVIEVPDAPADPERAAMKSKVDAEVARLNTGMVRDRKESNGVLANLGAGFDNVWQGAKQLVGKGQSDAEIEELRKIKSQMAEDQVGGGALQLTGEMIGSAPLTMGAGGAVAKVASKIPGAVNLAMKGGRVANLGTVGRGVVEGVAGGALAETTSDESKGLNSALGATMGAVAPLAVAGVSGARKLLGKGNASNRAAKVFEKQLGKDGVEAIDDALHAPGPASVLPLSTSAKSQSVGLAALERGARGRSDWAFNHDKKVSEAAWNRLNQVTTEADDLGRRVGDREELMQATKSHLDTFTHPTELRAASNDVSDLVDALRASPVGRQNAQLTNELGQVEAALKHPDRTAGDFASQYWRLNDMVDSANLPTEVKTAIMQLRDGVKTAADKAAGGQSHFTDMLERYKVEQGIVKEAESAKGIRETFKSPVGGVKTRDPWGGTPEVTAGQLRKSIVSKGEDAYGSTLNPQTRGDLEGLHKELTQHELYQPKNAPGPTQLEHSDPLGIISTGRDNPFNYFPLVKGGAKFLFGGSRKATTDAADAAMQDPEMWKKMMEGYANSKSPLSEKEYAARMMRQLLLAPGRVGTTALGD